MNEHEEFSTPKETIKAKRFFRPNELDDMRKDQTDKLIELDDIEAEIKELKAKYRKRVDVIKKEALTTRKEIKAGFTHEDRECYLVPDQEAGLMNYTDVTTGEVHMSRRLHPEERQLRLHKSKAS
jgi:hypothetical protein